MSNMSDRRIVVTGLGLICALGDGTDKCWSAASNGITGIREVQSVSTEGCYANKGAEVAESSEQLSGEDYDRSSLLCIKAAGEALADAGYTVTADNSDRMPPTLSAQVRLTHSLRAAPTAFLRWRSRDSTRCTLSRLTHAPRSTTATASPSARAQAYLS